MDRKFTELEKKTKTTSTAGARPAGRTTGSTVGARTTGSVAGKGSSTVTTPRESSRGGARQTTNTLADARQRSKTPTSSRTMQNNLNTSVSSKASGVNAGGRNANTSNTRGGDSRTRNNDL